MSSAQRTRVGRHAPTLRGSPTAHRERTTIMPWHGNHGWESHLTGLETRHRNGNLSDAGYARALRRFADRYEARAVAYQGKLHGAILNRGPIAHDLATAARLRREADALEATGTPPYTPRYVPTALDADLVEARRKR